MPSKTARAAKRASTSPVRELPTNPDALLTPKEAAQVLGVTERWIKRAVALRYFPHVRVGKLLRVRRADLLAYIEAQSVPAHTEGR